MARSDEQWVHDMITAAPVETEASFYRSAAGAEIDLVLALPNQAPWAIEIKRSLSPKVTAQPPF
jgi:hypothetical protein